VYRPLRYVYPITIYDTVGYAVWNLIISVCPLTFFYTNAADYNP
jgi:hypothetical protein